MLLSFGCAEEAMMETNQLMMDRECMRYNPSREISSAILSHDDFSKRSYPMNL